MSRGGFKKTTVKRWVDDGSIMLKHAGEYFEARLKMKSLSKTSRPETRMETIQRYEAACVPLEMARNGAMLDGIEHVGQQVADVQEKVSDTNTDVKWLKGMLDVSVRNMTLHDMEQEKSR